MFDRRHLVRMIDEMEAQGDQTSLGTQSEDKP